MYAVFQSCFVVACERCGFGSCLAGFFCLMMAADSLAACGDWPQILGPQRDAVAVNETLHPQWPAAGPAVLWQAEVGGGFAGMAVSGEDAVAFVREGSDEIVRCYDVASGDVRWQSGTPCSYQGGVSGDKGPRCVPLIAGGRVFTVGVEGRLRCLSMEDGTEIWQRDTAKDFRPLEGYFGVGSSPVLHEDRLILNVGGRDDAAVVAFDAQTGKTLWSAFSDTASYSSPVVMPVDGKPVAIVITRLNLIGLDTASAQVLFSIPFGARGPTVNGATPVILGQQVFVSSSYNIGAMLVDVAGDSVKEVWRNETLLATQYATPVRMSDTGSIIFAVDGRQDSGRGAASLKCIDLAAQTVLWEKSGFDYGSLIRVGDQLLMLTCGGELIRISASTIGYKEIRRSAVLQPTDSGYRLPALSGGRLFVRDARTLKCLDVGLGATLAN